MYGCFFRIFLFFLTNSLFFFCFRFGWVFFHLMISIFIALFSSFIFVYSFPLFSILLLYFRLYSSFIFAFIFAHTPLYFRPYSSFIFAYTPPLFSPILPYFRPNSSFIFAYFPLFFHFK